MLKKFLQLEAQWRTLQKTKKRTNIYTGGKNKAPKKKSHSFPAFIRMGWKLPGAGTPLTPWGLDMPQAIGSR